MDVHRRRGRPGHGHQRRPRRRQPRRPARPGRRDPGHAPCELLTGEEEGRLTFLGRHHRARRSRRPTSWSTSAAGRPSSPSAPDAPEGVLSVDVGCVRLTEAWLHSDPPAPEELSQAISVVQAHLDDVDRVLPAAGQAADRSSAWPARSPPWPPSRSACPRTTPSASTTSASPGRRPRTCSAPWPPRPAADRRHNPGLEAGRVDVIVGGAAVLVSVMRHCGFDEMLVSEADILDGLIRSHALSGPHEAGPVHSERLLLGPGPSNPYPEVMAALTRPVLGHLDPEFLALFDETSDRLRAVFKTANRLTLPVSGDGAAGMEACLVNLVEPGDTVIVGVNGVLRRADVRGGPALRRRGRAGRGPVGPRRSTPSGSSTPPTGSRPAPGSSPSSTPRPRPGSATTSSRCGRSRTPTRCPAGRRRHLARRDPARGRRLGRRRLLLRPPRSASASARPGAGHLLAPALARARSGPADSRPSRATWTWASSRPTSARPAATTTPRPDLDGLRPPRRPRPAPRRRPRGGLGPPRRRRRQLLQEALPALGFELIAPGRRHRLPAADRDLAPGGHRRRRRPARRLLDEYGIEVGGGLGEFAGRAWRIGLMGHDARPRSVATLLGALRSTPTEPPPVSRSRRPNDWALRTGKLAVSRRRRCPVGTAPQAGFEGIWVLAQFQPKDPLGPPANCSQSSVAGRIPPPVGGAGVPKPSVRFKVHQPLGPRQSSRRRPTQNPRQGRETLVAEEGDDLVLQRNSRRRPCPNPLLEQRSQSTIPPRPRADCRWANRTSAGSVASRLTSTSFTALSARCGATWGGRGDPGKDRLAISPMYRLPRSLPVRATTPVSFVARRASTLIQPAVPCRSPAARSRRAAHRCEATPPVARHAGKGSLFVGGRCAGRVHTRPGEPPPAGHPPVELPPVGW